MADDIRLVIGVEQSGLLKAITNTESLEKKVKKLSDAYARDAVSYGRYNKAIGNLATATKKSKKELLDYGKALRADEQATKQATLATKQFAQARKDATAEDQRRTAEAKKAAQAAAQQSAEEERLKNKFVQGYTAASLYSKELNDLAIARKRDIITSKQQKDAVAQLNAQMKAGTGVFAAAGGAMQQTARKTNQLGVLMQQSGYQIGDFAIQVQSGTNFMVAFGQQATQLVGTFAMLAKSTRMIALFSGLGIALPVLTAIGAYFIRAKDDAIDSAKGIEDAFSGLSGFFEDLSVSISDSFDDAFNNIEEKYGQLFTRLAKIKLEQTKTSLTESFTSEIAPIESPSFIEKLGAALSPGMVMGSSSAALEAQEDVGKSTEEVYKLSRAIAEVEARYIASVNGATSLNDIIDITTKTEAELALISEEAANAFALQAEAAGITVKIQEQLNDSQEKSYKRFDAHTAAWQKHQDKAKAEAQKLLDLQIKISATPAYEPMSALAVEAAKSQAEMVKIFKTTAALKEELGESAFEALRLGGVDLSNVDAASKSAALLAARLGYSYEEALKLQNISADPLNAFGGAGPFIPNYVEDDDKEPVVKESDLKKLRSQLDLEDALLGKTEARQRVIQALGVKFVEDNPKTVAGLEAQITANENLLRIEEERKRMNDLVTDSMENGLMAMADGTKTVSAAFRDMAREIIAELYRILVVQQMVNAAKSFFGFPFADGGAFSGGSQIQAYADGGVVGSPTLFPMAGGKTGLMGEAGPEAIMPLKRGANGKLGVQMEGGGGDNVVINQSFNFQANGDDSVKKIIAQAAPQIAQMTKNSMLNDRRRGGTTKAVFG